MADDDALCVAFNEAIVASSADGTASLNEVMIAASTIAAAYINAIPEAHRAEKLTGFITTMRDLVEVPRPSASHGRTILSQHDHCIPLPHSGTTHVIKNGWKGCDDLPCEVFDDGVRTVWKIPRPILKKMMRENRALSILVRQDGDRLEMSVVLPKVELTEH